MDTTIDVTIPVEPDAATALVDARNRAAIGRLVSLILHPAPGPIIARATSEMKADARAAGLTDADVEPADFRLQRGTPRSTCREMIVVDASTLISAALKPDSLPEQVVLRAEDVDVFALLRSSRH